MLLWSIKEASWSNFDNAHLYSTIFFSEFLKSGLEIPFQQKMEDSKGPQTDPKRTPNGPQTDPKRTPNGLQTDPKGTQKEREGHFTSFLKTTGTGNNLPRENIGWMRMRSMPQRQRTCMRSSRRRWRSSPRCWVRCWWWCWRCWWARGRVWPGGPCARERPRAG